MAVDLNYGIGVEGKNLVLKTLGRVYVKVKDRKYELVFRPEDLQKMVEQYGDNNNGSTGSSNLTFIDSSLDIDNLEYPGDSTLVISKDGHIYFTENNEYTEIPIKFSEDELTLENLNISGQIIFTGNNVPLVISNNNLIQNLNADLLDGYHATDFAIKAQNENIFGNWIFNGITTFTNSIGKQVLKDSSGQRIYIDFTTGNIQCNVLKANQIDVPKEESTFSTVTGIGTEAWVGPQISIDSSMIINNSDEIQNTRFDLIGIAWNNEELPHQPNSNNEETWTVEWWYDLFLLQYNSETKEYILRDFDNIDVWNEQNAKFNGTPYSLTEYQNIIDALKDPDSSNFTGNFYNITIPFNVPILSLVPNMIAKDNLGNIFRIVERNISSVVIQALNSYTSLAGDQLIAIGTLCRDGGILFNAINPSLSILKNVLDKNSHSVYFGELSKVDNTKSGIGMLLNGTEATIPVSDTTKNLIDTYKSTSEINITNPVIKWTFGGQNTTVITQDGSGYLSGNKIIWNKDNLVVSNSSIRECHMMWSTLDNNDYIFLVDRVEFHNESGFIYDTLVFDSQGVTKNLPIGPAGGDLTGNYPNPTIADGVITENNLSSELQEKIESGGSSSVEVEELKEQIAILQSNYNDLLSRIEALENTVGTLNTNLENRLNGN